MKHPNRTNAAAGFTLIELMVSVGITVIITGLLVANFSRTRVDLSQAAIAVTDGIREAQSLALTGAAIRGVTPCGYGVHFESDGFILFAEPKSVAGDCTGGNRLYDPSDERIRTGLVPVTLEIAQPTVDVFFEPPDPTTYINGSSSSTASTTIVIQRHGANCAGRTNLPDCRFISVSGTGQIQSQ